MCDFASVPMRSDPTPGLAGPKKRLEETTEEREGLMLKDMKFLLVVILSAACVDDPLAIDAPAPLINQEQDLAPVVASDGDDELVCAYLVQYYLDTGEVWSVSPLGCNVGGGGGSSGDSIKVRLGCEQRITRGEWTRCLLDTDPTDTELTSLTWTFVSSQSGFANYLSDTESRSWDGNAVESGRVTVSGYVSIGDGTGYSVGAASQGKSFDATFDLNVRARRRSVWSSSYNARFSSSRPVSPGQLDSCLNPTRLGITMDVRSSICGDLMRRGTPLTAPGGGPWSGLYYVRNPNISVNLGYQVNRELRSDDPSRTLNGSLATACPHLTSSWNVPSVNTQPPCARPNDFAAVEGHVDNHEQWHVDRARTEWHQIDLAEEVESMTRESSSDLVAAVSQFLYDADTNFTLHVSQHFGSYTYSYWRKPNGSSWIRHANMSVPGPR